MSLREPTLFTLAALRDGPLHGYAIAARARELSGGRVALTAGTLYGALDRLVASGLVEVDREEIVDGRKRRYHRLTEAGGHAVDEEIEHLQATVSALTGTGAGASATGRSKDRSTSKRAARDGAPGLAGGASA